MNPNRNWFVKTRSLLASMALLLGASSAASAALEAAPIAGTPYFMIVNKYSGKALDLIGGDTSNGARVNQWSFDYNGANQRWAVLPTENNAHFKLISWVSGKCACIDGDSTNNGAILHDWDYVGNNPGQQFDLVDAGNGWFKIRNVKSGKILDDGGWGTGNDNTILQWDDGGMQDNQLWRLQPWGDYFIRAASGRYLCVANMGNSNGSRIIQYDRQDNPWFKWRFVSEGDGWYGCFSLNALTRVLCVGAGSTAPGYYCHLWDYNPSNYGDQKVRVIPQLDGTFKFYFAHDGQTWDIPGGQTGNNVELDQYPNNGNVWQKFALERADGSTGGGGSTCNASTWTQGTNYNVGDIVRYAANGNYYKCTNANPGYDPTISTWFWSPTTCDGGGGNNGGGGGSAQKPGVCPQDQWNYMVSAAATLGMPADFAILLAAVDQHESSFGAGLAGSPSAGDGLMQVQPATRGAYAGSFSATFGHGYNDSASDQIAMGALIYKDMINLCGGQYRCGCMKYNGGPNYVPGSVDAYGRPIYAETYAAEVMATYQSWGGTHQ